MKLSLAIHLWYKMQFPFSIKSFLLLMLVLNPPKKEQILNEKIVLSDSEGLINSKQSNTLSPCPRTCSGYLKQNRYDNVNLCFSCRCWGCLRWWCWWWWLYWWWWRCWRSWWCLYEKYLMGICPVKKTVDWNGLLTGL